MSKLFTAYQAGTPVLWARMEGGPTVPLHLLGEGAVRLGSILLLIISARDGFVLIDEIENGLHWSVLPKVWRVVAEQARRSRTQVFATTHSWECLQAARVALAEHPGDLVYHRLEASADGHSAMAYGWEHLEASAETSLEVDPALGCGGWG